MTDSGKHLANETVVDLPVTRGFRGGRKPGSKNRRTKEVEAFLRPALPGAKKRLKALLTSDDEVTAMKAITLILAYIYGRPVDRREISGPDGAELPLSDFEIARRMALVLDVGVLDMAEAAADGRRGGVRGWRPGHGRWSEDHAGGRGSHSEPAWQPGGGLEDGDHPASLQVAGWPVGCGGRLW